MSEILPSSPLSIGQLADFREAVRNLIFEDVFEEKQFMMGIPPEPVRARVVVGKQRKATPPANAEIGRVSDLFWALDAALVKFPQTVPSALQSNAMEIVTDLHEWANEGAMLAHRVWAGLPVPWLAPEDYKPTGLSDAEWKEWWRRSDKLANRLFVLVRACAVPGDAADPSHTTDSTVRTIGPDTGSIALADLEKDTPPLDTGGGLWVTNKEAAEIEGIAAESLATYRKPPGISTEDKMFGRDKDGRIWRRKGTPHAHPWYLRSTLRKSK